MAIEPLTRRTLLAGAAASAWPAWATATSSTSLAAAWDDGESQRIGLLSLDGRPLQARSALAVPTRAHGLAIEPEGTLLAVARRPGDWLVRWHPSSGKASWHWNTARTFNGHVERRGDTVFTTETDAETGQSVLVLREAATLRERAAWPTHGRDAHDFLFDGAGALWVANGGIGTDTATGRTKDVKAMDSSLVRLGARSGELTGSWRLSDARLSLRHLALAADGSVGVALQAEHDGAAQRDAAPLLALWRDGELRTVSGPAAAGYGGDIAVIGSRFFVSAPRADRVLAWDERGAWSEVADARQACALATSRQGLWCGTADGVLSINADRTVNAVQPARRGSNPLPLDNHAIVFSVT